MLSMLKNRLGIPGVISVFALVFAMTGGAFAAKYIITSKSQIKPSVLKQLKGKRGPAGPAGAAGAQGPAGPQGAAGAKGDTGAAGANGGPGPVGPAGPTGPTGPVGPAGSAGSAGAAGATGPEGSPWTAGGTLPSGKTETGAWVLGPAEISTPAELQTEIPIAIPLAADLPATNVHYINAAGLEVPASGPPAASTSCLGTPAAPKAAAGHLCIYTKFSFGISTNNGFIQKAGSNGGGASTTGSIMVAISSGLESQAGGTYAVTAP